MNAIIRLFKLLWYLLWLPVHVVGVLAASVTGCVLLLIDIPLWVLFGNYGILSNNVIPWSDYHWRKIFGD